MGFAAWRRRRPTRWSLCEDPWHGRLSASGRAQSAGLRRGRMGSQAYPEARDDCMCFPDLPVRVLRHRACRLEYRDLEWQLSTWDLVAAAYRSWLKANPQMLDRSR